jgi:hypothetical protein
MRFAYDQHSGFAVVNRVTDKLAQALNQRLVFGINERRARSRFHEIPVLAGPFSLISPRAAGADYRTEMSDFQQMPLFETVQFPEFFDAFLQQFGSAKIETQPIQVLLY